MLHPLGTLRLFTPSRILDHGEIADRMQVDSNSVCQSLRFGALYRILRQQAEFSGCIQVLDYGKGLRESLTIDIQHRHQSLWIASQVFRFAMGSGHQIN